MPHFFCMYKKIDMRKFKTLLLMYLVAIPAFAQEIDETSLYVPKEILVIDTLAAKKQAEEIKESAQKLMYEHQYTLSLLNSAKQGQIVSADAAAILKELPGKYYRLTSALRYDVKKTDNLIQKISEGKVLKEFIPYIECAVMDEETWISYLKRIQNSSFSELVRPLPVRSITVMIPNTNNRAYNYNNAKVLDALDEGRQTVGWTWVSDSLFKEEKGPAPDYLPLRSYSEYPQYYVCGNYIFDNKGRLIRVQSFLRDSVTYEVKDYILNRLYVLDYITNKYNVKSLSSEAQYAIRNNLGISEEAELRLRQSGENILGALIDGVEAEFWGSERDQWESLGKFAGTVINFYSESERLNNKDAVQYLKELEEDHKNDLDYVYKIERTGNASFSILFLNGARDYTWQVNVKYLPGDGPFRVKKYIEIAKALSGTLETVSVDTRQSVEDVNLYQVYNTNEYLSISKCKEDSGVSAYIDAVKCKEDEARKTRFLIGYDYALTAPIGFTVGLTGFNRTKYWGVYAQVQSTAKSVSKTLEYKPEYLERSGYKRFSLSLGATLSVTKFGYLYAGIGYGQCAPLYTSDAVSSEDINRYESVNYAAGGIKGLECEVGVILRYKWIGLSVGYECIPISSDGYFGDLKYGLIFIF